MQYEYFYLLKGYLFLIIVKNVIIKEFNSKKKFIENKQCLYQENKTKKRWTKIIIISKETDEILQPKEYFSNFLNRYIKSLIN